MDTNSITKWENDDIIIRINTQILDEPDGIVILITRKIINKKNGSSITKKIYRDKLL